LIPDRGPLYALRVRGDSMIGANIHAGDLAIFRPVHDPASLKQGAIVVALVNGENTLKRLYRSDHAATLRAANEKYPDIQVQRFDDLIVQGELKYLLKKVES
jgi:repressor LexA